MIYSLESNVKELSCKMRGDLGSIMPWYMTNWLSINANKSAVMLIGRPTQVHDDVDIKINDARIEQVQLMKYLGIFIDNKLSWDVQYDRLYSNVAGKISVLRRIRHFFGLVYLNWFTKRQHSLLLIMPVLCGVIQTRQHLKITTGSKLRTQNCYWKLLRSEALLYTMAVSYGIAFIMK